MLKNVYIKPNISVLDNVFTFIHNQEGDEIARKSTYERNIVRRVDEVVEN